MLVLIVLVVFPLIGEGDNGGKGWGRSPVGTRGPSVEQPYLGGPESSAGAICQGQVQTPTNSSLGASERWCLTEACVG